MAAFRDMIGECPKCILDLAASCCRVSNATRVGNEAGPLGASPPQEPRHPLMVFVSPPQLEAFKRPSFTELLEELEEAAERLESLVDSQSPG